MRKLLVALELFTFITAIFGGLGLVLSNGAALLLPLSMLDGSPFRSYLVPGLLLIFLIGGTQLAAALVLLRNRHYWSELTVLAGLALIIWLFMQLYWLRTTSILQIFYFLIALAELVLTFLYYRRDKYLAGMGAPQGH
jgi:hypothetical protein